MDLSDIEIGKIIHKATEDERERTAPIEAALRMGLQLSESGGHGSGPNCPTCHFVREARKALGLPVPQIERPVMN